MSGKNIQCPKCHHYQGREREKLIRDEYYRVNFICLGCGHTWTYWEDEEGHGTVHVGRKKYV